MTGDYSRIQRIEDAVIKLERDMAVMSDAVTRTARAVETLAETRMETQLLRNDYEHAKKTCEVDIHEVKKELRSYSIELKNVRDAQRRNTWVANAAQWLGMTFIASAVSFIWWLLKTDGV
jgi:chromosome segregation ATPase